nr:2936_t:CDS:2 [Entrophospora candida]
MERELSELNKLKEKYLSGSSFIACERSFDSMSFVDRMSFNEAKRGYPEPNEEQKKEIELNNRLKTIPQEIRKKEIKIEGLKKKMEEKTI